MIVGRGRTATGCIDRATGWKSRIREGTYKTAWEGWEHLTARTSRYLLKPDKVKIDNDFSAYDHPFYFFYLNGNDAWKVVNLEVRQCRQLTDRMKDYAQKADGLSHYLASCDILFTVEEIPTDYLYPTGSLDSVGCLVGDDTTYFDFDRTTHLLLRQVEIAGERTTIFDDHRETQELMVPYHVMVYRDGEKSEEFLWKKSPSTGNWIPRFLRRTGPDGIPDQRYEGPVWLILSRISLNYGLAEILPDGYDLCVTFYRKCRIVMILELHVFSPGCG